MDTSYTSNCHYFKENVTDEAWGLTVSTSGYQEIAAGTIYPPKEEHPADYWFRQKSGRVLKEYQLIYITKGEGTFSSAHVSDVSVKRGDIIMVFPGEWHDYQPKQETGWDAYWVGFKGNYIDHLIAAGFFTKDKPVIAIGLQDALISVFCEILDQSNLKAPAYQQRLAGAVSHILAQIYSLSHSKLTQDDPAEKIVTEAKILMRKNVYQNINPEQVAEALNISYSLFRKVFKAQTGLAPAQYFQKIRLQKAKELLINPSRTIKEISYTLNFETNYYFSTYFKNRTGQTPTEFRREFLKLTH